MKLEKFQNLYKSLVYGWLIGSSVMVTIFFLICYFTDYKTLDIHIDAIGESGIELVMIVLLWALSIFYWRTKP